MLDHGSAIRQSRVRPHLCQYRSVWVPFKCVSVTHLNSHPYARARAHTHTHTLWMAQKSRIVLIEWESTSSPRTAPTSCRSFARFGAIACCASVCLRAMSRLICHFSFVLASQHPSKLCQPPQPCVSMPRPLSAVFCSAAADRSPSADKVVQWHLQGNARQGRRLTSLRVPALPPPNLPPLLPLPRSPPRHTRCFVPVTIRW